MIPLHAGGLLDKISVTFIRVPSDKSLFKHFHPMPEPLQPFFSELCQTALSLHHCFLLVEMGLGEKFVGIADHLFLEGFGQEILVGQGEALAYDLLQRQSRASVPFAHTGMALKALLTHHGSSEDAVAYIGFRAVAEDAGSVGAADADVMEHGGFFDEHLVEMQFGVPFCDKQGFLSHRPTMNDEDAPQGVILVVV